MMKYNGDIMDNNKKNSFTFVWIGCIMALMGLFVVGAFVSKETYSISCSGGYSPSGSVCVRTTSAFYTTNKTGTSAACTYGGSGTWSCSAGTKENDDGDIIQGYNCTATCSYTPAAFTPGCYVANNSYLWTTVDPGSSWTKVDISQGNCNGCVKGYVRNDDGDCVKDVSSGKCYISSATNKYAWLIDSEVTSGYSGASSVSRELCSGCAAGFKEDEFGDCQQITCDGSCDNNNTGTSGGNGGNGGSTTPSSSSTTPPSSSTPSSSSSSNNGSNTNVNGNPQTGSVAIFVTWIIGLFAIVYTFWYFKSVIKNN